MEFAIIYSFIILPLGFMLIFVAEMLWIWHSVVDFTRDGANYAATHCWQSDGDNVSKYMTSHVPLMIDMDQFISGAAGIAVSYYQRDPTSGSLSDFSCDSGDCTTNCIPDVVSVSITGYQFTRFSGFFRLPAVPLPDFHATMPMGGAGCDETGTCLP
jgi:hypothetical protein